jgi:outer membrane protein OmpA-like peptidoglycan-associated protein
MKIRKSMTVSILAAVLLAAGCRAPAPVPPPPPPPALQNLIVLLPNEDGSSGSSIVVTNAGGSQELTEANTALKVDRADPAPSKPFKMDPSEIQSLFQSTLSFIPTPEARFNLYFLLGGTELTPESVAVLPRILEAYKERHSTDVSIIGHTDTTGDSASNVRLGLARAEQVAKMIQTLGVDRSQIFTESHGATDLLVPTKENVAEPRNRRVEVIVR